MEINVESRGFFFKMAVTARLCADGNLERGADLDRQEEVIAGTVSLNSDKTESALRVEGLTGQER